MQILTHTIIQNAHTSFGWTSQNHPHVNIPTQQLAPTKKIIIITIHAVS